MFYFDPPYGIKYGSNFQPYVRNKTVSDSLDDYITREPEMVQAYRDTWQLGVNTWLTYMRDRLLLARELLDDTGSCFVQINDEHLHFIRNIMDEIFGPENFVSQITFKKTSFKGGEKFGAISDYIVWYSKTSDYKFNQLYAPREWGAGTEYKYLWFPDKPYRILNEEEASKTKEIPPGSKVFSMNNLLSTGSHAWEKGKYGFKLNGEEIPKNARDWRTTHEGMMKLIEAGRVVKKGKIPSYVFCYDDLPVKKIYNLWGEFASARNTQYVVETNPDVIQRCILMTTGPGDLVIDPTCGGGTSAYVAEKWGRRWITMDVSRVPLSLTRQRLLTSTFDYYYLQGDDANPGSGFVYRERKNRKGDHVGGIVPHVTLETITKNENPKEIILVDKPEIDKSVTRVCSPFCVESILPPATSLKEKNTPKPIVEEDTTGKFIKRMIETLRLAPVIRLPENNTLTLSGVSPIAQSLNIHAQAEMTSPDSSEKKLAAIVFGPSNSAISNEAVLAACEEASEREYVQLLIIAFAIDPETRSFISKISDNYNFEGHFVQANTDIVMGDLLKNLRTSQIFSITGLPDVKLRRLESSSDTNEELYEIVLHGLDCFDPLTLSNISRSGKDVPCWMLDTDYDNHCFRPGQVFFPRTKAWDRIRKTVKADFKDSVWERLASDTSEPFVLGDSNQIAVKVIDDRGNELMKVITKQEAVDDYDKTHVAK